MSSVASSEAVLAMSFCPAASFTAQRLSDATASMARTGWPSCHLSPLRRTNVYVSLSGLIRKESTIWGRGLPFESSAKSVS